MIMSVWWVCGIHWMSAFEINTSLQRTQSSLTHTHTHTRERERIQEREREIQDKLQKTKLLGGIFCWAWFTGLAEPGKRTGKHNNKKQKGPLKSFSGLFQSCGEEQKNILDLILTQKRWILKGGWRNIIGPYEIHLIFSPNSAVSGFR